MKKACRFRFTFRFRFLCVYFCQFVCLRVGFSFIFISVVVTLFVATSAVDCLERVDYEITCYVLSGTLNCSITDSLTDSVKQTLVCVGRMLCAHLGSIGITGDGW